MIALKILVKQSILENGEYVEGRKMIIELMDFIDNHEELIGQKTITQLVAFLYGYLQAPQEKSIYCVYVNFVKLSQILGYSEKKYWFDSFVERYNHDEVIAYHEFIEIVKKNADKLEVTGSRYFPVEVKLIDSFFATHIVNAMGVIKRCPLLSLPIKSVVCLRAWLCGYITANLVSFQKCAETGWEYVMPYVKNIMDQFDRICEGDSSISWDLFFVKYNEQLNAHGLDLENIIQEKLKQREIDGIFYPA